MLPEMSERRADLLNRLLGLATCVVAALPILVRMARGQAPAPEWRLLLWLALLVAFLVFFWVYTGRKSARRWNVPGLAVLSALALAMVWLVPYSLMGILLVVVAVGLGEALPLAGAAAWIVAQTALYTVPILGEHGGGDAATLGGAFLGFQLFALYASHTADRERRGREALARANTELLATRRLLDESSRNAERLRIARDLHDVLGHHLTALSLHLEAARHAGPEESRREVETARGIAGDLLSEVRQVVGRLRDERPVDLPAALAALAAGVDRPRVHLAIPDGFGGVADADHARALLRCAQEMLTNAIRHSRAENLWMELREEAEGIDLTARDDGVGAPPRGGIGAPPRDGIGARQDRVGAPTRSGVAAAVAGGSAEPPGGGLGLAGMRERLERLGGRLSVDGRAGEGFQVSAWLPHPDTGAAEP
jgi:signal transduction histidine kinase